MADARYTALSEIIAAGIKDGRWSGRLPGVRKFAQELGADPATLAKAFRLLAEKGIVTIQGTKGTFAAASGHKVKNNIIGIVGVTSDSIIRSEEMDVMESEAARKGYKMLILAHNNIPFLDNEKLLLKFPVDAYVFMYSSLTSEIASFLKMQGISFVSCNRPLGMPGVSWADFDMPEALEKTIDHLVMQGHEKIAYIEYYNPQYGYSSRMLESYKRAFKKNGLAFDKDMFVSKDVGLPGRDIHKEEYLVPHGQSCARELLSRKKIPDAAIFSFKGMEKSFLAEMRKNGVADIPVISYCSKSALEKGDKSVIVYDYRRRASAAIDILTGLIDDPFSGTKQKLIEGKLMFRGEVNI